MKLNIAHPRNGTLKQFEANEDSLRRGTLYEHRLGQDVEGSAFAPEFSGYVFRLTGGSDKDGFPMVQGVLANARVALLLKRGRPGFKAWRGRSGERRRKSVRGCIVGSDIAMLNLVIVKIGEKPIEGVTNANLARRLGPKRASKIRKMFQLGETEDVRKFTVRRKVTKAGKKDRIKTAKVQRLITPSIKARRLRKVKVARAALEKSREARREFLAMIGKRRMAARQRRHARTAGKAVATKKQTAAATGKK